MQLMEVLFVATGFTGAVTLIWLARIAARLFTRTPVASAQFGPGASDRVVREVGAARREVLLLAGDLACPPITQALIDAKTRKAGVDVILGPDADAAPLSAGGLLPLVHDSLSHGGTNAVLVDGRTLLVAGGPFAGADGDSGHLLVFKDHPELIAAFRERMLALRASGRQPQAPAAPVPVFTLPPVASQVAAPAPIEAPPAPATMPAQDEVFSYSFPAPAPAAEMPAITPPPPAPVVEAPPPAATAEPSAPLGSPPATLAAAELFARLRREVAAARELEGAAAPAQD